MRLKSKAFALTCGIIWGLAVVLMTFWVMMRGGGNTLILLEQFYFGYSVSFLGAIIGFIWGFVDGFIGGWFFAWLYNYLTKPKEE